MVYKYKVVYHIGKKAIETDGQSTDASLIKRSRVALLLRAATSGINAGKYFLHQILK